MDENYHTNTFKSIHNRSIRQFNYQNNTERIGFINLRHHQLLALFRELDPYPILRARIRLKMFGTHWNFSFIFRKPLKKLYFKKFTLVKYNLFIFLLMMFEFNNEWTNKSIFNCQPQLTLQFIRMLLDTFVSTFLFQLEKIVPKIIEVASFTNKNPWYYGHKTDFFVYRNKFICF